ncbi:hypothetical protein P4B35_10165 [Pontiellaceae bacterium B12227]|nr:hypothetical protein [Pontiellaceae bacterium B12227]
MATIGNKGLCWENSDLMSAAVSSGRLLRGAMHSDGSCEVKRLVDAGLLETLWLPKNQNHGNWPRKDLVRSELADLAEEHPEKKTIDQQLKTDRCSFRYKNPPCPRCDAGSLLARVLLGPMDWFFENERTAGNEDGLLWVIAKLYDQFSKNNFFRTLSCLDRKDDDYRAGQLLIRLPEQNYDWFKMHVADFSTLLRETEKLEEVDYCLVFDKKLYTSPEAAALKETGLHLYDISSLMKAVGNHIAEKCPGLREKLIALNDRENSDQMASKILSPLTADRLRQYVARADNSSLEAIDLYMEEEKEAIGLLERVFFNSNRPFADTLNKPLQKLRNDVKKQTEVDLLGEGVTDLERLANYFIWLHLLHPGLGTYTVRYASSYQVSPSGEVRKKMQNPCFVLASRMLPSTDVVAATRLALTHIMGPLEDYYVKQWAILEGAKNQRQEMGEFLSASQHHDMNSLETHVGGGLDDLDKLWDEMPDKVKRSEIRRLRSYAALAFMGAGIDSLWDSKRDRESLSELRKRVGNAADFREQHVLFEEGDWNSEKQVPQLLRIVFANLMVNAVDEGGDTILVGAALEGNNCTFVVRNKEPMPKPWKEKAFDDELPERIPDKNRGLWICRRIVEKICGGKLELVEDSGEFKTNIYFTIPLNREKQ